MRRLAGPTLLILILALSLGCESSRPSVEAPPPPTFDLLA